MMLPQAIFARPLAEIQKTGIVKIATADIDFRPVHYRDDKGNRIGIDIDLINIISLKLKVKPEIVLLNSLGQRIQILLEDKADLVISNFSVTPERQEQIDFSISYVETGIGLLLHNKLKDKINGFDDVKINAISIALVSGSTQHKVMEEFFPNVKLLLYKTSKEAFQAFVAGEADAYSTDELFLRPTASQNPEKYYLLPGTLSADSYGVGVNKNYPELRDQINLIIEEITRSGELQKIIDKHTLITHEVQVAQPLTPTSPVRVHMVADGESLAKISYKYYGKYTEWKKIYEANKDVLPYPSFIKTGVELKIPSVEVAPEQKISLAKTEDDQSLRKIDQKDLLEYISSLYKRKLISKEVYEEVNDKGKKLVLESQLNRLKEKYTKGAISKEGYIKEQLSLLREFF
jgi:polar amino acid transport system substrate-binding protein